MTHDIETGPDGGGADRNGSETRDRIDGAASQGGARALWASPFFRLLAINWLIGAFASVLVLAGLLWFDTANLRSLIFNSSDPVLPIVVLLFGLMITLCSAAMGAAVMALGTESARGDGGGGGHGARRRMPLLGEPALVPAPVRAKS
ncbi:hypothetical protein [Stappia sp.]|uniref:hypothetical protein n=1 Tax=Stappia sp. TaxID=1870903 RepID=UPI0032D97343